MTSDAVAQPFVSSGAGTRSVRLVAAYLAASAIPVLRHATAGGGGRAAIVAAVHLSVLALVALLLVSRPRRDDLVAWIPLILWPALYSEVPAVIAGMGTAFHDATVQGWESAIFRDQPARTLAAAFPNLAVSEVLHAGYLSYYGLIYLPPAILFATGRRAEFARTVFAVTVVWLACLIAFAVFPVAGPRFLWGPSDAPNGPVRSMVHWVLERGSARGTAFPSSHVAVAVAQSMVAVRVQRPVGVVAMIATLLLAIGAVYGGFHYAVDVVAGVALGATLVIIVDRPVRAGGAVDRL